MEAAGCGFLSCSSGPEWVFRQLPPSWYVRPFLFRSLPQRANTQGNDDMTAITAAVKAQSLFLSLFFFSLSLSAVTFVLLAEIRKGSDLGLLLDLNERCFGMEMSSLFLLLLWMSLYWMFSTTIDLQWDMDLESELTKSNWEKILGSHKCAFVACSFYDSHCWNFNRMALTVC